MTIIAWLVIGAIAGYVANYILRTREGLIRTVLFGIAGALVGGAVGAFLSGGNGFAASTLVSELNVTSLFVAILGAVGLGALGGWWARRSA